MNANENKKSQLDTLFGVHHQLFPFFEKKQKKILKIKKKKNNNNNNKIKKYTIHKLNVIN